MNIVDPHLRIGGKSAADDFEGQRVSLSAEIGGNGELATDEARILLAKIHRADDDIIDLDLEKTSGRVVPPQVER